MKVIITGGTGLLGGSLVPELASAGYEVIVLSRSPEKHHGLFRQDVRLVAWDGRSADGWGDLVNGADAIVNLAGENLAGYNFFPSRWTDSRKRLIRESRLEAGEAVVEAVRSASIKPSVVVQISAVGYYGPQGDKEITEADPPADDFLSRLAVDWENSTRGVEAMGVRHVVLRGPKDSSSARYSGALPRLLLPARLFAGGPIGGGKQWYTWIHPKDASRAIRFLIEREDANGPYNLVSPQPLRSKDFSKAVGKALGRPSWLPAPAFAFRLAFGEVASVVLTGQRVIPARLQELDFQFEFPEAVGAIEEVLRDS